jgi:ribosomal protein L11 methyltransferase
MAWAALVLELPGAEADRLCDRLVEIGADSVTAEDAAAGTPGEEPLFDEPGVGPEHWTRLRVRLMARDEATARALLEQACGELAIALPPARAEQVPEQDWVRSSQAQFGSLRISDRLWVVPSWQEPVDPDAIQLRLDPGLAFGTGSHPTTRLCLQWLEREIRGGERVLDYGCGSGILAIAAMKLGALQAVGVDIDAPALDAARANARVNGVACEFIDAKAPLPLEADLIVANILANPLKLLAPALARLVRAGGKLALAGLLTPQAGEVAACYRPWFEIEDLADEEGWTRISLIRRRRRPARRVP